MVSFRPGASRASSASALQPRPCEQARPSARSGQAAGGAAGSAQVGDAAIRRDFEALAGRIRLLQQRAAREAARLAG